MKGKRDFKPTRSWMGSLIVAIVATALCSGWFMSVYAHAPTPVSETATKAILIGMAEFMAKTQTFTVNVMDNYDVYQQSGQKIEFGETRKITVARPDRVRVDVEQSNGDRGVLIFDGRDITMLSVSRNLYAQARKPGSIDDAVVYFVRDLGMRLPFAVLLLTTAPEELERRTKSLDYVEKTTIYGIPAHHIAGRTESVDYQVWIADGDKPVPLRLVLTYSVSPGQPEFRAQFSDWNFTPDAPASLFTFTPSPGAQQIAFLAQLPRSVAMPPAKPSKSTKPAKSGGQK